MMVPLRVASRVLFKGYVPSQVLRAFFLFGVQSVPVLGLFLRL